MGRHDDEQRNQQNSYLTVIRVHSTMHLMHPNYCQIYNYYLYVVHVPIIIDKQYDMNVITSNQCTWLTEWE